MNLKPFPTAAFRATAMYSISLDVRAVNGNAVILSVRWLDEYIKNSWQICNIA